MKSPHRFFAGSLAIGFFAVLPVLLFYLLLGQLVEMLLVLTTPVLDLLPDMGLSDATRKQVIATMFVLCGNFWTSSAPYSAMTPRPSSR